MKVVTFGEGIFRTSTESGERLSAAKQLDFYLGGTELNLAANLKSLGIESEWVSALPSGPTGQLILEKIRQLSVETKNCSTLKSPRSAWYLMETGAEPRPDVVLHRQASAMADEKYFNFNWAEILNGAALFHTSGVTAGLSETCTDEVKKALSAAKRGGLLTSYDLNYRKNIWSLEESVRRQRDVLNSVDILFCSKQDLKLFFSGAFDDGNYSQIFSQSQLQILVMVQRSHDNTEYGIEVVTANEKHSSTRYKFKLVDRIGVGDSAAAGFIKCYLSTKDLRLSAQWAALAGALKYGIKGDMALLSESEIKTVLEAQHSGVIR